MTTAKKAAKKTATAHERTLTTEEKLDGLIAYLAAHGLHYDGSPAPEKEEDEAE